MSRLSQWRDRRAAQRAANRAAKAAQRGVIADFLPPEGVPIRLHLASLGARFRAQCADLALSQVVPIALVILLAVGLDMHGDGLLAVWALSSFFFRTPYYIFSEILWNGRTIGKRMCGIRVISADGRSLSPRAVVLRNLMKEGEILAPITWLIASPFMGPVAVLLTWIWIGVVLAVPMIDTRRRRLGDMIAGTIVIVQPKAALLPDLAVTRRRGGPAFLPHQLDLYGAYELQTLERLLQAKDIGTQMSRTRSLEAVSATVRAKIEFTDPVPPGGHEAFLRAFYIAQRLHLEQKQLMGDRRADKRHNDAPAP